MSGAITLKRADLVSALAISRVVERRNTIPILSNVKLVAGDGTLKVTATDLDIMATAILPVEGEIATTVPAHLLHEIVRKLPEGCEVSLTVNAEGTSMAVRSGRSNFRLQCLPVSDFPDLSEGETPVRFTLSGSALKRLLSTCQFAISNEETRYYLNGIYLCAVEGEDGPTLRAVATDGHRLARCDMLAPEGGSTFPGVIVPRKTVAELIKLGGEAGEVEISLSDSKLIAETASLRIVSKLIDGTFPDYQRVIPNRNDKIWKMDRQAFINAADRVSTISSERGRAVKLEFAEGKITLQVKNPDSGDAQDELAADGSEAVEIGFNAKYLAEVLGAMEGETAEIRLADSGSPTLFTDPADTSALFVLMPMRTS